MREKEEEGKERGEKRRRRKKVEGKGGRERL
jgi:hypothetical protein